MFLLWGIIELKDVFSLGVTIVETERTQTESKNNLARIREIIFITVNRENRFLSRDILD